MPSWISSVLQTEGKEGIIRDTLEEMTRPTYFIVALASQAYAQLTYQVIPLDMYSLLAFLYFIDAVFLKSYFYIGRRSQRQ